MTSRDCPRTLVCPLELRREDRQLKGTLVLAFDDQAYSVAELAREILGGREGAIFRDSTTKYAGKAICLVGMRRNSP